MIINGIIIAIINITIMHHYHGPPQMIRRIILGIGYVNVQDHVATLVFTIIFTINMAPSPQMIWWIISGSGRVPVSLAASCILAKHLPTSGGRGSILAR